MALINENGNYIRINKEVIRQALSNVQFNTFKNKETRLSPTEFDVAPNQSFRVDVSDELINSIVETNYEQMKQLEEYQNCIND